MQTTKIVRSSARLPFLIPSKSKDLAEFCGIMLGDGGISKYQTTITLHSVDDEAYSIFVVDLIRKLFGIQPGLYKRKSAQAVNLVISRIALVEFLTHECGLPLGNKISQKADIPGWIKQNRDFSIACVRGLIDTDGSVFTHRYISKGKEYSYKKLSFTSVSGPLLYSVRSVLEELGMNARIGRNYDVRLDSKADNGRVF